MRHAENLAFTGKTKHLPIKSTNGRNSEQENDGILFCVLNWYLLFHLTPFSCIQCEPSKHSSTKGANDSFHTCRSRGLSNFDFLGCKVLTINKSSRPKKQKTKQKNHLQSLSRTRRNSSLLFDHSNGISGCLHEGCRALQVAQTAEQLLRHRNLHRPELTPEDVSVTGVLLARCRFDRGRILTGNFSFCTLERGDGSDGCDLRAA